MITVRHEGKPGCQVDQLADVGHGGFQGLHFGDGRLASVGFGFPQGAFLLVDQGHQLGHLAGPDVFPHDAAVSPAASRVVPAAAVPRLPGHCVTLRRLPRFGLYRRFVWRPTGAEFVPDEGAWVSSTAFGSAAACSRQQWPTQRPQQGSRRGSTTRLTGRHQAPSGIMPPVHSRSFELRFDDRLKPAPNGPHR
ncbi:MAG TPA: hypothetical protein VMV69_05355, partial [Pirellulales bacterium]|nr:hypothetical protein [Pirellulales bacterium]